MMPVPNQHGHHHANSGVGDDLGLGLWLGEYGYNAPMGLPANRGGPFGMGDAAPIDIVTTATNAATAALKKSIIESAAQMAAVQVGAAVALMVLTKAIAVFVPIGTIIGLVLSVIQMATSIYTKRVTKEIISDTVGKIKAVGDSVSADVTARAIAIGEEEFPAAQALAASGQPLEGFGLGASWFTQEIRRIAPPIARPVIRAHAAIVRAVGNTALNLGIKALTTVGDKHGVDVLQRRQDNFNNRIRSLEAYTQRLATDPIQLSRQIVSKPAEFLVGTQQLDVIRKRCYDLLTAASQDMATTKTNALAQIESPEYRTQMRTEIALQIRQDPQALAQARQLAQVTQRAQTLMDNITVAASSGATSVAPASGVGGALALGAAAILGFLWLKG